jgi:aldehyde:ferredoxin oxidoreductase
MRYAETGYSLEVDLSTGNIEKVETDPKWTELYLGGQGIAAKILWDRVPPEVEPFSPENLLIFSAGLLHGTPVPGANRTAVNTFSPQTNFLAHSLMGGFFGPELKHAGYDRIVISGKAPDLVYLWINNDKVEIRDASHLRGKGIHETTELIRKELNEPFAQVAAIGLAGENRVYTASIEHGFNSAARGPGPVMGDKRLKAIAVRGTKEINIAQPAELFELCIKLRAKIAESMDVGDWMAVDEDDSFHHDNFAWGNARVRIKDYWSKELEERWRNLKYSNMDRQKGCYNCSKKCINVIFYKGRRFGYKCYGKDTYHMAAFKELDFSYEILPVAMDYGVDSYSTAQVIAFATELYEAGILTDKDLPGFPSDSGARTFYLLEKIVRREGIGDVLANGVYWAARQIGKGAEKYDHNTTKKFEQLPIKLGKLNPPYFLMIATGEKMAITQIEGSFPQDPLPTREEREAFVKKWEPVLPDEKFKKWFLEWEKRHEISNEASCAITDWNEAMHFLDDSLGFCGFLSSFRGQFGGGVVYHINNMPEIINLAHGMEMDKEKLWRVFQRNRNLVRALNVRRGLRRADERPPDDHWAVRDHEFEQKLLDDYYEFKGWTKDGIPIKETLDSLQLDYVSEDFIRRGILTGNEGSPSQETRSEKDEAQKTGGC